MSARPNKVEDFHSHCNETVSGWYHLSTAPKGKGSHSWGCFVGRQVERAVPLTSSEYSPELIKARGGMESGEMVLSADVMIAQQQARAQRFRAAGSAAAAASGGRFADAALGLGEDGAGAQDLSVRAPVSPEALAAAEAAEGGRASVEDSLSALLRGDGEGVEAAAAALGATSHQHITAFLETRAAASVSSDEAIRGLESAEAAAEVVRRINEGADAGARLWRAEVPTHLLGLTHEEARKRLGASASGKDVRAMAREAKASARAAIAAAGTGAAAGSGHGHGHGKGHGHGTSHHAAAASGAGRARVNRRIAASEASTAALEHAHRMRLRARGAGDSGAAHRKHAVADLSGKYGPHTAVNVDISAFPKSLDWSTVAGGAYIPDVLDQGHCGSCYAASATDALTARARIKAAGKLNGFSLSTQSVVQCSGHNQGCDGGYPYLVGKFGREIGFVPSECMHYTGRQDLCPARVDCPQAAQYASLWAGLAAPQPAFLEIASESEADGQAAAGLRGAAAAAGSAAGEDALVAALQMQVQAEHAQSAAAAGAAAAGAGAGPLGFAFHPHQRAAIAGERQLPQFRQHHEAAEGEGVATAAAGGSGEALDEVAEQLAAGLMGAEADVESELAASLGGSGSGVNKGVGHGKTGHGVVEGSLANTYALSDERLRVSRYEYVGGFYGAGSESAMIAELQKGPLVVALNAPGDLFYYGGGIYHHDEKPEVRQP